MCVVCVYFIHTTQFTAGFQPGDTIEIIRTDGSVVVDSNWLVVSIKCCKGPQSRSPEYHRCKFLISQRIPLSKGIIFAKSAKKKLYYCSFRLRFWKLLTKWFSSIYLFHLCEKKFRGRDCVPLSALLSLSAVCKISPAS